MRRTLIYICSLSFFVSAGLFGACRQAQKTMDTTATDFVRTLHGDIVGADWAGLYHRIDFDAKGRRMLGDVYASGTPQAKRDFRATMERQFRETTTRYWPTDVVPRLVWTSLSEKTNDDGTRDVTFHVPAIPPKWPEALEFVYTVRGEAGEFVLEDRELRQGGRGGTLAGFVQFALGKLRSKLGREPTLSDWNENFTQLMSGTRVRQIEVPSATGAPRGFQR